MQAAHVTAPGTVRVDSFADPEPATGHAVVRPELISICGSDLLAVYGQPADAYPLNPGQSGHEVIGVVEAVEYRGKTVFPFEPGERVLATPSPHVGMAERFAIDHYKPVWNRCLDGFGDHDPGSGRYNGEKSWWDTMHPGRGWADNLRQVKTLEEAIERVQTFFASERS